MTNINRIIALLRKGAITGLLGCCTVFATSPAMAKNAVPAGKSSAVANFNTKTASPVLLLVSPAKSGTVFQAVISNPEHKKLWLTVTDAAGMTLMEQSVTEDLYRGLFDMSLQEDGRYTVAVSAGNEQWSKELELVSRRSKTGTFMVLR